MKESAIVSGLQKLGYKTPDGREIDKFFVRRRSPEHSLGFNDDRTEKPTTPDGLPDTPYVADLVKRIENRNKSIQEVVKYIESLNKLGYSTKEIFIKVKNSYFDCDVRWTQSKITKILNNNLLDYGGL